MVGGSSTNVLDFSANGQKVGLRFTGVSIPQGAKITKAYIRLMSAETDSGSTTLTIKAQDADSASAFSSSSKNLSSRALTSASASWATQTWNKGQVAQSGDISSVVQEVVSRGGWDSGNPLALVISGDNKNNRRAVSVNGGGTKVAPTLYVWYSGGSDDGGDDGDDGVTVPSGTPSSGSCLNRSGSLVRLKGSYSSTVTIARRSNVKVDARGASMRGNNFAFVAGKNSGSFCLSGGSYSSNRSSGASWSSFHSTSAIYAENVSNPTIENVTTSNSGDCVTFKNNTSNHLVKDSYFKACMDDAYENDRFNNGSFKNNLVDRAFTFFSCRAEAGRVSPRNVTVNIEGNVIGLRRLPNGNHNYLFKWGWGTSSGCRINLRNNVFLLENQQAGYINPNKDSRLRYDPLNESACRGNKNVVVYTGGNRSYLAQLKAASPTCFDVTTDIGVWNRARSAWLARH